MKYKKTQQQLGINPDPNLYIDVRTKDGWYRRKKRPSGTPLNKAYSESNNAMKLSAPAASRLLNKLEPWLRELEKGRILSKISGGLRKRFLETGRMDYAYLKNLDIQPAHKLSMLLRTSYHIDLSKNSATIKIQIRKNSLYLPKSIATHFFFEAIILWGNPMKERGLKVESEESKLYTLNKDVREECILSVNIPHQNEPWMLLLKVSCLAGNEMAHHPRHYALKVIAIG